jgi:hypothetical protein
MHKPCLKRNARLSQKSAEAAIDSPARPARQEIMNQRITPPPRARPLAPAKFRDAALTAKGERRASVKLRSLKTLWFNTGTLCNITCANCYIESSPKNDRLAYLALGDVRGFLDEIAALGLPTSEIGFTGGEPFMNPAIIAMLDLALARGFSVLVLTNAMQPMMRPAVQEGLLALNKRFGARLTLRVSLDHYARVLHDGERGADGYDRTLDGLKWLAAHGFRTAVAGRTKWGEPELSLRAGFEALFRRLALPLDAFDPRDLVLFPEMDARLDVPEISEGCWSLLGKSPDSVMCASSRMVIRRKGAPRPSVVSCTLLPYDSQFELGQTLAEAAGPVALNHPFCAQFCVLGGASCSVR